MSLFILSVMLQMTPIQKVARFHSKEKTVKRISLSALEKRLINVYIRCII